MKTKSSRSRCLLCALTIWVLLMSASQHITSQLNSRAGNVSLVARLESLSVASVPASNEGLNELEHNGVRRMTVMTSWAIPSNRTTVRVFENGMPVFSQASGESSGPGRRTDQIRVVLERDGVGTANTNGERNSVVIVVEAL